MVATHGICHIGFILLDVVVVVAVVFEIFRKNKIFSKFSGTLALKGLRMLSTSMLLCVTLYFS